MTVMPLARSKESDPRFVRSRAALLAAVRELASAMPVDALSVSCVATRAGVTRPTFYQHFADVPAAAREAAFDLMAAALPLPDARGVEQTAAPQDLARRLEQHVVLALRHLAGHRPFYLNVLDAAASVPFFDAMLAFILARQLPDVRAIAGQRRGARRDDLLAVLGGGMMWWVIRWLHEGEGRATPEAMARQMAQTALALLLPGEADPVAPNRRGHRN